MFAYPAGRQGPGGRAQPSAFLHPGFSPGALIWPPGLCMWNVRRLKGTWEQELALSEPFSNAMSSKVFARECLMPSSPVAPSDTGHTPLTPHPNV